MALYGDRGPRCPHGWKAQTIERDDGWLQLVAPNCKLCAGKPAGIPFKPGKPPGAKAQPDDEQEDPALDGF